MDQNTHDPATSPATVPPEVIQAELSRLVAHPKFAGSPSVCRFLTFVVEGALKGRQSQLKEYVIGVEAMGRGTSFDPRLDPIVRVQARKLRSKLQSYYETAGADSPVRIELSRGTYVPEFRYVAAAPVVEAPGSPAELSDAGAQAPPQPQPEAAPRGLLSRAKGKWMVVGAGGLVALSFAWLAYNPISAGFAPAQPTAAHIEIEVAPAPTSALNAETVAMCSRLAHQLDDAIEDGAGIRLPNLSHDARLADLLKLRPRIDPGSTLVSLVDTAGNHLSVDARLVSREGRLLWSGIFHGENLEIAALSHDIARELIAKTGFAAHTP